MYGTSFFPLIILALSAFEYTIKTRNNARSRALHNIHPSTTERKDAIGKHYVDRQATFFSLRRGNGGRMPGCGVHTRSDRVFSSQTRSDNGESTCFTTRKRHLTKRLEKFSHVDCASLFLARSTRWLL